MNVLPLIRHPDHSLPSAVLGLVIILAGPATPAKAQCMNGGGGGGAAPGGGGGAAAAALGGGFAANSLATQLQRAALAQAMVQQAARQQAILQQQAIARQQAFARQMAYERQQALAAAQARSAAAAKAKTSLASVSSTSRSEASSSRLQTTSFTAERCDRHEMTASQRDASRRFWADMAALRAFRAPAEYN